ncbi:hypothetical protein N7504_002627 [Penicillium tannophilum]|nr:hypothetical protein N7504_002627 [Penicillium tannophilum]
MSRIIQRIDSKRSRVATKENAFDHIKIHEHRAQDYARATTDYPATGRRSGTAMMTGASAARRRPSTICARMTKSTGSMGRITK